MFNRYPLLEDVGNNVSNERNLTLLKEMEREKPRKDTVLALLRQTFPSHHTDMLSDAEDDKRFLRNSLLN